MKWKVSDDLTVLEMLVNNESVDVIANEIGATTESLKMRIKNYQHIVKGGGYLMPHKHQRMPYNFTMRRMVWKV